MTALRIRRGLLFASCQVQINAIGFEIPNLLNIGKLEMQPS